MASAVRFHPLVADDISNATAYYDKISIAVGNRFRTAVKERIATVAARPESFGRVHEALRAARVSRFPYVLVFEHEAGLTQIVGLFHSASDQANWKERNG